MAEISGGRVRGSQRLGWMDGVEVALGNRGMTVEAARQYAKDVFFRTAFLCSGGYYLERGGMPLQTEIHGKHAGTSIVNNEIKIQLHFKFNR